MKKFTETDVILKFAHEVAKHSQEAILQAEIELPAGSWRNKKKRNQGDIRHIHKNISAIEGKGNFTASKKDIENADKNVDVKNYLYASSYASLESDLAFWEQQKVDNVLVYTSDKDRFYMLVDNNFADFKEILGDKVEVFRK